MPWLSDDTHNLAESEPRNNIRVINISGIGIGILCMISAPIFLYADVLLLGWILLPIAAIYLGIPVINHFGYQRTAKWCLFLNFNLGTFFFSGMLGNGFGLEYLYVVSLVGAFFLFDSFIARTLATLFVIAAVVISDFDLFIELPSYNLNDSNRIWLRNTILPGSLVIITSAMLAAYARYDSRLNALLKTIELARTDELTQLNNRFSFKQDGLNRRIFKQPDSALAMLDLDGLKAINDVQGHRAGDDFLKQFATLVVRSFPEGRIYRFGGDEFVIWLQNADNTELRLTQLNQAVEGFSEQNTGVSFGICFGREADSIEQMIDMADGRMYQKKASSKRP